MDPCSRATRSPRQWSATASRKPSGMPTGTVWRVSPGEPAAATGPSPNSRRPGSTSSPHAPHRRTPTTSASRADIRAASRHEGPYARVVLVTRAGLSPVMVGRTAELNRLRSLIGASPVPAVALIAGEAGIGKTRLARELIDSTPPHTLVLAGQADPGTVGRPMELFLDSLRRTDLGAYPELGAIVSDPTLPADDRVRAGVDLVHELTSGRVGLVVFEDLHWADSESLTLFERLADPDGGQVLAVGTYR